MISVKKFHRSLTFGVTCKQIAAPRHEIRGWALVDGEHARSAQYWPPSANASTDAHPFRAKLDRHRRPDARKVRPFWAELASGSDERTEGEVIRSERNRPPSKNTSRTVPQGRGGGRCRCLCGGWGWGWWWLQNIKRSGGVFRQSAPPDSGSASSSSPV